MHILFLSHYFPPEVNAPASRTYEHARRWAQAAGVKVTVVTNHPNHPSGVLYPGYVNRGLTRECMDGIEIYRVKTYLAANAGFARRILNYLTFMVMAVLASMPLPKPGVVAATSPQFFCALAGYLVSCLKGCPFVFELRDLWPESIIAVGAMRSGFFTRLLERLELFLYRRASLIIALTDAFKENLVQRGIPPDKIQVVKNGVDLTFFSPREAPAKLREETGARGKFVAAYIGTVGLAHAVEQIVAVAGRLRNNQDILFMIVGEGAQKGAIEKLVAYNALQNVKVLPGVSKDRVRDYYALSDVNLVTLKKADLFRAVIPSKIFEIMAMARPMLFTVNGECRQIIDAAGSGIFVEPENVEQMAQALTDLSRRRGALKTMALNGRRFVEQHFSRDELARRYLELLRQVQGPLKAAPGASKRAKP